MEQKKPNLVMRNDTLLGVCEAIGEDFRIHPNILRIGFGLLLFVSAAGTVALYLILGAGVALSRWLYPKVSEETAAPAPALAIENQKPADTPDELEQIAA